MNLRTRKRTGAIAVALAMAGALLAPAQAYAADGILEAPIRLETGHIDAFNPVLDDDGSLRLALKEDVTGSHVLRTPESVELFVKPAAQLTVPEGYLPGMPSSIYLLPLTQDHTLIWPGWDTQGITSVFPGADTDIVVSAVDGPGEVFLWTQGGFGQPASLMKGGSGYTLPNTISQPYPAHTHANWAFTAPGTYKFTVRADVTAGNGAAGSSQSATYTFVVAERTQLTPETPTQDGSTVTIPAQDWVAYTDGAGNPLAPGPYTLDDGETFAVSATPALGFDLAEGAESSWNFEYEAPAPQAIAIVNPAHHYHQGSPIPLTVSATPEVTDGSYEWFVQRVDQPAPVKVEGETGAALTLAAEQALDNAQVTARLLAADGATELAVAPAITIDIDDHGAAPFNIVTVSGAAGHYHTGDTASLTASVSPASVLTNWVWEVQRAGETGWTAVDGASTAAHSFEVTEELEGALVRARLAFDDGAPYVASAPVEIEIDDHHGEEPVETTLSIAGLAHHYHTGDVANLTAVQDPETGENHYHWFVKRAGDESFAVIPGALTANLAYTVTAEDADAEIIVRLYDHDHAVIAESTPVVIEIDDHHGEEPGDEKPDHAPVEPAETVLDGIPAGGIELDKSTVAQGGTVTVQIGEGTEHAGRWVAAWMFSTPVLLGGDWQQVADNGTILVRIPADAAPGAHRIAVFDAAGSLIGWQSVQVTSASTGAAGTAPGGGLATTGADLPLYAIGGAALLILAAGAALMVARRRTRAIED